jgi:2-C-methyl-D-erythritol 4-phosphate cytidylyltransferase/2-C-methyl-D-erythritol 2,4-cyclodiphosphate synthase
VTVHGIVVAAGSGERFGGPKATALLNGKPLWEWARDALVQGGVDSVVVVGPVADGIAGGERRRDSVAAGLAATPNDASLILVHDAARPLASSDLVARVIDRLREGDCDGAVPAVPVRDALKKVDDGWVVETLERKGVVAVQTPQGFLASALRNAHASGGDEDAVDDAVLVERSGGRVAVVDGELANLKITYPSDLGRCRALLR